MKKEYIIRECLPVAVEFAPQVIRVFNGKALQCLMKENMNKRVMHLVESIKSDYKELFHKELAISDDSLAVEILMHVYAEKIVHSIARFVQWKLIWRFHHFVKSRCDVIDCGEAMIDNNRRVWDLLGKLKKLIFR